MVYFFISTYFSIDKQSCKETYTLINKYIIKAVTLNI